MNQTRFISFCFIGLLIFTIYQVLLIFSPFFEAIFWAAILAFGFYPLYEKLRRVLNVPEGVAALLCTLLIFLIVLPPLVFVIINLTAQAIDLYQRAYDYVRGDSLEELVNHVQSLPLVRHVQERMGEWEPLQKYASDWILGSAKKVANMAATHAGVITKNLFFIALNLIVVFFLTFIFLKDGRKIFTFIYETTPLEEKIKKHVYNSLSETFSAVIRGQVLTAITQSVIAGIVFWNMQLPLALFFAMLTFVTAMIPIVGASTVWLPLVIYLLIIHSYGKALALLLFGMLVISLIDNIVKPALIGEKTKLPYLLLCLGMFGGIKLYGLTGVFLAPVVLSLFFGLVRIYQEKDW